MRRAEHMLHPRGLGAQVEAAVDRPGGGGVPRASEPSRQRVNGHGDAADRAAIQIDIESY